jgi:uncharacterized repeat protein (TIGR03943 family)
VRRRTESDPLLVPLLCALVAVIVLRLTLGDGYRSLVRSNMRWPLIASAAVLIVFAIAAVRRGDGHEQHGHEDEHEHEHEHEHGIRPAIYLIAPVLLALLVAPQPLGSFAAGRTNVVPSPESPFEPLPAGSAPAVISLLEFNQRALDREGETLLDVPVELTGFVMSGNPLRIARFRVACCAADGQAAIVELRNELVRPGADRWVTVIGTFDELAGDIPTLNVTDLREIRQPTDPYEAG